MSWNWRNRKARLMLGVALIACALILVRPLIAHAGYPLKSQGRVALGFGAAYTSADATSSSTHRGIDIAAEPSALVVAPFAGTVTFSGRVPAVGGGTVRAVTISTSSGSVTLLPLSGADVAKGDSLGEGDAVGMLAADGDGSSTGTHLHVGVKRGDLYIDPMSLLTLPVVAPDSRSGSEAGAPVSQGSAGTAGAGAGHATSSSHAAGGASSPTGAHAVATSLAGARAGASAPSAVLRPAVPGARLSVGVSVGGVAPQTAPGVGAVAAQRALAPLRAVRDLPARAQASAQVAGSTLDALVAHGRDVTGHAVRVAGMLAAAVLGGVGLLWPLWRREERKGSGEEHVSAIGDDIAAAVGQ